MLTLVSVGPQLAVVRTGDVARVGAWLEETFAPRRLEALERNNDPDHTSAIVAVVNDSNESEVRFYAFSERADKILGDILSSSVKESVVRVRPLPQTVVFNALGDSAATIDKIEKEVAATRTTLDHAIKEGWSEGSIILFLTSDDEHGRIFAEEMLYIDKNIKKVYPYLQIHAPRYLAKAFAPDTWHMVDLRIFDRYEAYALQYDRLVKAIKDLHLGYIVTETWNLEVGTFKDPVGTYKIRLLTFMTPLELKKILLGLEYSDSGSRIVDLDLYWHDKKVSWKHLMDDKATRKEVDATAPFFPKSNFFAVQNDKLALINHCKQQLTNKMSPQTKEAIDGFNKKILEAR